MKYLCRVCLRHDINNDKLVPIFQVHNNYLIADQINSFTNFTIVKNDGLPDKICPDCLLELENFVHFKEKCEKSNEKLHDTDFIKCVVNYDFIDDGVETELVLLSPETDDNLDLKTENEILKVQFLEGETIKKEDSYNCNFICDDCGDHFKSKCKLRVHWRKVHLPTKLQCVKCKRQFKSFKSFNIHKEKGTRLCQATNYIYIEGTGKTRKFYCKYCPYETSSMKYVITHVLIHSGEKPYKCDKCAKAFSQFGSLQRHKDFIHKECKMEIKCESCGKCVNGQARLYKHMLSHHDEKAQCEYCKKLFKSRQSLKIHMLRHSKNKRYTCEKCAANFYTITDLCNHKRYYHNTHDSHVCSICGFINKTFIALALHKKKHTDTNICCILCGKFVNDQEDMIKHKKWHLDRAAQCSYCEKNYCKRKTLKNHVSKMHTHIVNKHNMSMHIEMKQESIKNQNSTYEGVFTSSFTHQL